MSIILLAPSAAHARQITADLTVEAEYGAHVWEGTAYTAAHHQKDGPYAGRHLLAHAATGRPSPCNDPHIPVLQSGLIGVSHLDLDTIGGVLRADPVRAHTHFGSDTQAFWDLAEAVDTRGAHRLPELCQEEVLLRRLHGFWAWSKTAPRFDFKHVHDVSGVIDAAALVLLELFVDDPARIGAGAAFVAGEAALNARSYVHGTYIHADGGVILRHTESASDFVNHLYRSPSGALADGVVAWNREKGSITISVSDPDALGVDCRALVQSLWGPESGGHAGIAGGPREVRFGFGEADRAVAVLRAALAKGAA